MKKYIKVFVVSIMGLIAYIAITEINDFQDKKIEEQKVKSGIREEIKGMTVTRVNEVYVDVDNQTIEFLGPTKFLNEEGEEMKFVESDKITTYSDGIIYKYPPNWTNVVINDNLGIITSTDNKLKKEPPIGQKLNMMWLSIKSIEERLDQLENK